MISGKPNNFVSCLNIWGKLNQKQNILKKVNTTSYYNTARKLHVRIRSMFTQTHARPRHQHNVRHFKIVRMYSIKKPTFTYKQNNKVLLIWSLVSCNWKRNFNLMIFSKPKSNSRKFLKDATLISSKIIVSNRIFRIWRIF